MVTCDEIARDPRSRARRAAARRAPADRGTGFERSAARPDRRDVGRWPRSESWASSEPRRVRRRRRWPGGAPSPRRAATTAVRPRSSARQQQPRHDLAFDGAGECARVAASRPVAVAAAAALGAAGSRAGRRSHAFGAIERHRRTAIPAGQSDRLRHRRSPLHGPGRQATTGALLHGSSRPPMSLARRDGLRLRGSAHAVGQHPAPCDSDAGTVKLMLRHSAR